MIPRNEPQRDTGGMTGPLPAARGELPPAALALARLVGECLGERVWREAMAEVEAEGAHERAQAEQGER